MKIVGAIVIALVFSTLTIAQEKTEQKTDPKITVATPELKKEENLILDNLLQKLRISQLEIQKAQLDFEKTSKELTAMIQDLQKPGYTFDVEKRVYTKKPDPVKK
jgi:hypothetical protein